MDATDEPLPPHRLLHHGVKRPVLELILREAAAAVRAHALDKDAALDVTRRLKANAAAQALGQGEWNCFVGRHLSASLSHDSGLLAFFELLAPRRKTVLVFKA